MAISQIQPNRKTRKSGAEYCKGGAVLLALCAALLLPDRATALEMAIESKLLQVGQTISLRVTVDEAVALGSFFCEIEYGGPGLQLERAVVGDVVAEGRAATNPEFLPSSSGLLRVAGAVAEGFSGSGELFELTFVLPDTIRGDFPVTFRQVRASDTSQQELNLDLVDGGFRVVSTAVEEGTDALPNITQLLPSYPNPFNPATHIPFQLEESAAVVVHIHNANGQRVRSLDLGQRAAGYYAGRGRAAYWDGRNDRGQEVGSGVYLIDFRANDLRFSQKITLLK
jgi:hypothetical protein